MADVDLSALSQLLTGQMQNGNPNLDRQYQNYAAQLAQQTAGQIQGVNEDMAARGLGRSGISFAARAPIYQANTNALTSYRTDLDNQNQQYKQSALAQLLGLGEFQANLSNSKDQFAQNLAWDKEKLQKQLDFQKWQTEESKPSWLGSLLGGVSGTFLGGLTGGYAKKLIGG